jgi:hypothetical protein
MACQTCDHLFAVYQFAVKLYAQAMGRMTGLVGADFQLALKELERLRGRCREANDAMTMHWQREHVGSNATSAYRILNPRPSVGLVPPFRAGGSDFRKA